MTDDLRIDLRSTRCIYCGDLASGTEHWPPKFLTDYGYLFTACLQCNVFAGRIHPWNFHLRALHVKSKINEHYTKILLGESGWTLAELDELGQSLRDRVLWSLVKDKRNLEYENARKRVAWNAISYIQSIDSTNCFVPAIVGRKHITDEFANSYLVLRKLVLISRERRGEDLEKDLKYLKKMSRKDRPVFRSVLMEFGEQAAINMLRET